MKESDVSVTSCEEICGVSDSCARLRPSDCVLRWASQDVMLFLSSMKLWSPVAPTQSLFKGTWIRPYPAGKIAPSVCPTLPKCQQPPLDAQRFPTQATHAVKLRLHADRHQQEAVREPTATQRQRPDPAAETDQPSTWMLASSRLSKLQRMRRRR